MKYYIISIDYFYLNNTIFGLDILQLTTYLENLLQLHPLFQHRLTYPYKGVLIDLFLHVYYWWHFAVPRTICSALACFVLLSDIYHHWCLISLEYTYSIPFLWYKFISKKKVQILFFYLGFSYFLSSAFFVGMK
jgi:hypothetical protein